MIALGALLRVTADVAWWPGPAGLALLATLALELTLCCAAYGTLLAATGQWLHLSVLVGVRRG